MGDLVVEQAYTGECHGDGVFVAGHDDMVVANGTACLGDILYAALVGALDIVAEWKKASEPNATRVFWAIQAFFSSRVSTSG